MKRFISGLLGILLALSSLTGAEGTIKGLFFGDYYYMAKSHRESLSGKNGFWLRRIYLTYDYRWTERYSMRLRLEMAHPGDFTSSKTAVPFVKDAYLKYQRNRFAVLLGISPTPTFAMIERIWGYRAVEKTPIDLQKMGSSRDFGIAFKGSLNTSGTLRFHAMLGNGNGNKSETNSGKKAMLATGFYPKSGLMVEAYGDYEDRANGERRFTTQLFAAYRGSRFRAGLQLVDQQRLRNNQVIRYQLASLFAVESLNASIHLLERIDYLPDGSPAGDAIAYLPFAEGVPATLIILGLDYTPTANVHLIPNVETIIYDSPTAGSRPENDVMPRLTFFVQF